VRTLAILLCAVFASTAMAEGPDKAIDQKIAVWRFDALGIEPELVQRLETLFRMELDRLDKVPQPSRRDIERTVTTAEQNCTGEEKCLTAIGKRLGVEYVVTGTVGSLGDNYVLNIKVVDVATGKSQRIQSDPLRGSPDELIEGVRVAAYSLLAPDQLYGSVVVLSDLVGASVSLDGKAIGPTPLPGPIAKQSLGKHRLKVEAKGYQPFDEEVEVRFQKSTRVVVRLATAEPVDDDGRPKVVVREEKQPWWTSKWAYVGAGVLAVGLGALIGWQLGKDEVVSCVPPSTDPRCL
jgi:hypothetical protein